MYNKYIDKLVSSQYLSKKIVLLIDVIMSVVSSGVAFGDLVFYKKYYTVIQYGCDMVAVCNYVIFDNVLAVENL